MIKKHKKFSWPRKLYDSDRIAEENKLVEKYGLKNKREIWKTEARVAYLRNRAKKLITAGEKEQGLFFSKLNRSGLNVQSIADVLALTKENLFQRRLGMILIKKNFATAPKQARQMISHKRVLINGKVVSSPGYTVGVDEENVISIRSSAPKAKPAAEEPAQ
jgi:small subunit ribosomal protein S4